MVLALETQMAQGRGTRTATAVEDEIELYGIVGTYMNHSIQQPFSGVFTRRLASQQIRGKCYSTLDHIMDITGSFEERELRLKLSRHDQEYILHESNILFEGTERLEKRWVGERKNRSYEMVAAIVVLGMQR